VDGVDAYLSSLDMTLTFRPFDNIGKARIAQLINKSNQYNLTTRRYTESEVTEAQDDPDVFTLQARLSDIFGDNGMISVVICQPGVAGEWEIDTWLMSCRVLGRKVEQAVLQQILGHARVAGITRLVGIYRPTDRNKLVADHYAKLGFVKTDEDASGTSRWELIVKDAEPIAVPMKMISEGFGVLTGEAYEAGAQQHVS
jgi:FkbH-like protein